MEPVAISWLVASATTPLIAVLALWTVYVFHTYRQRWRTVDLFLLAVASQELISSIFSFGYAITSLINPSFSGLCSFIHWGLISTRTFQIATLTSMVVDRALTVRWPYRYRFSVRRNQIRYHVAVLALLAVLVGVASVFANVPDIGHKFICSAHPMKWDFKFIVFLLGFYGVMMLLALACTVQIEVHKCRNGSRHPDRGHSFQLPDCTPSELPLATSAISPLDSESHTGSTRALHRPHRQSSRRPYTLNDSGHSDFRWPPVALVSLVCFSINHLPFLVLTAIATASPWLWTPWLESLLCWLRLAEGVLVPTVLCASDNPLRSALKRTFQRRSGTLSPLVGDDCPFQMYFDKDHFRKKGTFGSVTPIGIITNYRRAPGKKVRNDSKNKYKLPGLHSGDSVIEKSCLSGSFLSTEPLSKLSCADLSSLEVWQEEDLEDKDFYATMSDSCTSADENTFNDDAHICEELYGGSFTTIANDDFEFHDTRPCGGEVRMRPSMAVDYEPRLSNSFRCIKQTERASNTTEKYEKEGSLFQESVTENLRELKNITEQSDDQKKYPSIFLQTDPHLNVNSSDSATYESDQLLSSLRKAISFSMNDLGLISSDDGGIEERVYELPVKSESTMSLYRLRLDKDLDQLLPTVKSENNLNTDSGFGSGTQTMNPIWAGYQIRNTSDSPNNVLKPQVSPTFNKIYPCILHPRMQRIPWISAWKKLGCKSDNSLSSDKKELPATIKDHHSAILGDNFQLRSNKNYHWKDSVIYGNGAMKNLDLKCKRKPSIQNSHVKNVLLPNCTYGINATSTCEEAQIHCKESYLSGAENSAGEDTKESINDNYNLRGENIYEEIISNNGEPSRQKSSPELSYAQSDVLNLEIRHNEQNNNLFKQDFTLNINLESPFANIGLFNGTSSSNDLYSSPTVSKIDVGGSIWQSYKMPSTPDEQPKLSPEEDKLVPWELANHNRVHVSYKVNDSALQFIDSRKRNGVLSSGDNAPLDPIPNRVMNQQDTSERSSEKICPNIEPLRVCGVKRRRNRNSRSTSFENNNDVPSFKRDDNIPIIRRESARKIKHGDSGSRTKNLTSRYYDSLAKKSQSGNDDAYPCQRIHNFGFVTANGSHESLSKTDQKDEPLGKLNLSCSFMKVDSDKSCLHTEISTSNKKPSDVNDNVHARPNIVHPLNGGLKKNIVELDRKKGSSGKRVNVLESSNHNVRNERGEYNGIFKASDIHRIKISKETPQMNSPLHGSQRLQTDTSPDCQLDWMKRQQDKSNYDEQDGKTKRDRRTQRECPRRQEPRRKGSVSADNNKLYSKFSRKQDDPKRRASLDGRGVSVIENDIFRPGKSDMNRNECGKRPDMCNRIDNISSGKTDNGISALDTELFPFENFLSKPPSYDNVVKQLFVEKFNSDPRDMSRQKKVSITHYL